MEKNILKIFLRLGIGFGFLSAVADRFGLWPQSMSTWGNWDKFMDTTSALVPWTSEQLVLVSAVVATGAEIIFGLCLVLGIRVRLMAKSSGVLMLIFGLAMFYAYGIKAPFDYSVFAASGAAFALGTMKNKFLEIT